MNILSDINDKNAYYILLGAGAFLLFYVVLRPLMKRKKDPFERPPATGRLSQQRSVERQMESLLVELSEMSRQMSSQLDTRAAKLEFLIKDADERIGRLQQLQQSGPATTVPSFEPVPAVPSAPPTVAAAAHHAEPPHELDPRHEEIYTLADTGKSIAEIATTLARPSGEIELILALRPR
jgi:hypothetical protein